MVTARRLVKGTAADTPWTDLGSTKGIPDRWQTRNLCGLWLTVGHNGRNAPDYVTFTIPASQTPWKVYALAPNERAPGQLDLALVASGTAPSAERARSAAEASARAWRAP